MSQGHVASQGQRARLVEFIVEYLRTGGRLALIEDALTSPLDAWLAKEPVLPPHLACGARLYWPVELASESAVAESVRWGTGPFTCIAMTPQPLSRSVALGQLTVAEIVSSAHSSQHVVVDAFDFEGFVIWSRP
jgi:hypothetical protein